MIGILGSAVRIHSDFGKINYITLRFSFLESVRRKKEDKVALQSFANRMFLSYNLNGKRKKKDESMILHSVEALRILASKIHNLWHNMGESRRANLLVETPPGICVHIDLNLNSSNRRQCMTPFLCPLQGENVPMLPFSQSCKYKRLGPIVNIKN